MEVKSNVTVGNGAEAERVAKLGGQAAGRMVLAKKFELINPGPSKLVIEPESSIEAAADVVEAMAIAAGGSGWLWLPS